MSVNTRQYLLNFNISNHRSCPEDMSTRTRVWKLTGEAFPSTHTIIEFHTTSLSLLKILVSTWQLSLLWTALACKVSNQNKSSEAVGWSISVDLHRSKLNISNLTGDTFANTSSLEDISTRTRIWKLTGGAFLSIYITSYLCSNLTSWTWQCTLL